MVMMMYREWAKNNYGLIRFEDFLTRVMQQCDFELDHGNDNKTRNPAYDGQLSRYGATEIRSVVDRKGIERIGKKSKFCPHRLKNKYQLLKRYLLLPPLLQEKERRS